MFPQMQKEIRPMATADVSGEADDKSLLRSTFIGSRVFRPIRLLPDTTQTL